MKLNWGHSIFLVIVFFSSLLLYGVYRILFTKEADHQLVSEKYYEEELDFQKNREKIKNGDSITNYITVEKLGENSVKINFSENIKIEKGEISFYCPFEKKNDFKILISKNSENNQIIKSEKLIHGKWTLNFKIMDINKIEYLFKKEIQL